MSNMYLAYKGKSSDDLYTAYLDQTTWYGNTAIKKQPGSISPKSDRTPGAGVLNGLLYLVYKRAGVIHNEELYTAVFDGNSWTGDIPIKSQPGGISPESIYGPGVAVYRDSLYIVYRYYDAQNPQSTDVYVAWFKGGKWFGNIPISLQNGGTPQSQVNPAVCVFNDKLYIVYPEANSSSNNLYTAWFDGNDWQGNTAIHSQPGGIVAQSQYSPGIAVFKDLLYLSYRDPIAADLRTCSYDGQSWKDYGAIKLQPGQIDPVSDTNPGVAVYRDRMYLVYDSVGSEEMSSAEFDGNTWDGNTLINSQAGSINPESNYNPSVVVY